MQANIAIGLLENSSIALGVQAADAMCKMAQVTLNTSQVIARGKFINLIAGPVGEIESAMRAGIEMVGDSMIHQFIIRNVHSHVLEALKKRRSVSALNAFGLIETKDAVAAIHAADAAAKSAKVHLLDVKIVLPGGKGYVSLTGDVGAVKTAVGAGIGVVPDGMLVKHIVIPQPDVQLLETMGK
jgi:microcompartment protein CcmL/EutN